MSGGALRQPLVLLVSARPGFRERLADAFGARGYQTGDAGTSREALTGLAAREVAAMVIDEAVPEAGGLELAEAVRAHPRGGSVSLILLTDGRWSTARKAEAIQSADLVDVLQASEEPAHIAEIIVSELASRYPQPPERLAGPDSEDEKRHVEREARAVRRDDIELRGNLTTTPFPQLLHTLYVDRADGALFLLRDNVKKIVYFQEGHPVYVKSNLLSECLGNVLVREKMISEEQCEDSLVRMRKTRRQQGTVLIEMGVISPQNLVVGLELQLTAKLLDIFSWHRGEYLFKRGAALPSEVVRLELSNASLIAEGVRKRWDTPRTRAALEPYLDRYLAPARDPQLRFQEIVFDELEQAMRDEADGTCTVRELCERSPLPDDEAKTVAYIMIASGVVEAVEAPLRRAPSKTHDPDEEKSVRRRLVAELHSLSARDPFGVLGVSPSSSDREVEQAYSAQAKRYHPDRFRKYSADTRRAAREVFGVFYAAYNRIATEAQRVEYREQVSDWDLDSSDDGRRAALASRVARDASIAIDEERYDEAVRLLEPAASDVDGAADLRAMLGWARFCAAPDDTAVGRQAIRELRQAIDLLPNDYLAHLYLGRVYARMGKRILAEKQFEKALTCNPDSSEALEELRIQKELRPKRRR